MGEEPVRLFCLEMYAEKRLDSLAAYSEWLEAAVRLARPAYSVGHKLLVFPEYVSFPLIRDEAGLGRYQDAIRDLFAELAQTEGAYVLACGPSLTESGLYNQAKLFDPTGTCLLSQQKCNLTESERKLGFQKFLQPPEAVQLPFGKLGIAICLDAFDSAYLDGLQKAGVQILLQPSANPQPWNKPARDSGVWQPLEWARATAGAVSPDRHPIQYLVNPFLRGDGFDGQSSIVRSSSTLRHCPYEGVSQDFRAEFLYCSPYGSGSHRVGWADLG